MKKKSLVLTGMLVTLLSLSACGSSNDAAEGQTEDGKTKISFSWWGSEVRHEKYIAAIELYEENNPDIDIEFEYSAWDDYWKKLATKSAAGELPDVVQMDRAYIAQYGEKNQLADLNEFINNGLDTSKISDNVIEGAKLNGKLYALPTAINAMSMLVNPEQADQGSNTLDFANYTFEDFINSVQSVSDATGNYGWTDVSDNAVLLQYFLRTKGEDLFKYNADGKPEVGFTKESFVEFMEAIQKLSVSGALPTAEVINNVKSFDEYPFSLGEAGYLQTWSNQFVTYQESAGEEIKFNLELPYDSNTGALSYNPTFYYSVTETSKNKEEATKFLDFLVNDIEANKIIGTERGIPANTDAKDAIYDDMTADEKRTADYLTEIEDMVGDPSPISPVGFAEWNNYFKELYAEITYNTMTPEDSYDNFVQKAEEIFNENYN